MAEHRGNGRPGLIEELVARRALRVAPAGEVFWYTSGTVGPYYINTHFLFGGPETAAALLAFIDAEKENVGRFVPELSERCRDMYDCDPVYGNVVDCLAATLRPKMASLEMISGGERRDWFFSVAVAHQLDLPHLYLYKDGRGVLAGDGAAIEANDLPGQRSAHVADLVTEASSYRNAWVPALRSRGGCLVCAANVIDRDQGGEDVLRSLGVESWSLLRVDEELFAGMLRRNLIDADQKAVLEAYRRDPHGSMRRFLEDHPRFLEAALASDDPRTAERARLLVKQDLYGLHSA